MSDRTLTIMRGLPYAGKSYRAKEIVTERGSGVIFSTDDYWYTEVKPDRPDEYSFNPRMLGAAHRWNQQRAFRAIERGEPLVVIDNTNTTAQECAPYVAYAVPQGYAVTFEEPTSDRWREIRPLLADKKANKKDLKAWAETLADGSRETHRVPAWAIERMMWRWQNGITVEQALACSPTN